MAKTILLALSLAAAAPSPVRWSHLFSLSTATGADESTWASLAYDRAHDEVLVLDRGAVRVFNAAGMQTYAFGGDDDLAFLAVAVLEGGDLVAIGARSGQRASPMRCNFRGEPVGPFELRGVPAAFERFEPDAVVEHQGRLYFVERARLRVVVTDPSGAVTNAVDVARAAKLPEKARTEGGMTAFGVGADGSILFTIATLFTAWVVPPSGEARAFGVRGSTPGKFNNLGGITTDERGTIFVTDRLRSVVMVFDRELRFRGEFGYRGDDDENLVAPYDVAVGNGKVYVAQAGNRGVSVFKYELD